MGQTLCDGCVRDVRIARWLQHLRSSCWYVCERENREQRAQKGIEQGESQCVGGVVQCLLSSCLQWFAEEGVH